MDTIQLMNPQQVKVDENIIHWVWDDNPDEAYCGADMTNHEWVPQAQTNCPKCMEIADLCDQFDEAVTGD